MLAHEVSTQSTIDSSNLTKMLLNQVSASKEVLQVPHRPRIISLFVVVGIFNLLLKPEVLKDLEVDKAGVKLLPTMPLVLKS